MRDLLLILILAVAAGALVLLLVTHEPDGGGEPDLSGPPAAESPPGRGGPAPMAQPLLSVAEVVPPGRWDLVVEDDEVALLDTDPRFALHRRMQHPSQGDWSPTGAEVLDILSRTLGGQMKVRFRDQQALDDFKKGQWPILLPPEYRLSMLLDTAVEVGFQPILRADGVYMIRVQRDEPD